MTLRWRKLGRVFDPRSSHGRDWLVEFAQAPSALVLDDVVRVYVAVRGPADAAGQYVSRLAYVDLDRGDLTRVVGVSPDPILPLGGLGEFDEFGTYPASVVADDEGGYRMFYGGWTRCESVPFNVGIGAAVSADGATFTKVGRGPILPYTPDEPYVLSGPKIRRFGDRWYLFYIAGRRWKVHDGRPEPVYKIRVASSADGWNWDKHGTDLVESRIEPDEAQASPDVTFAGGRYHMFFCYRYSTDYRGAVGGYRIGYASSADLVHWERDDGHAGLPVGAPGDWDDEMVAYPHMFAVDGRTYMAYLGNQVGRWGFGLAVLDGELA